MITFFVIDLPDMLRFGNVSNHRVSQGADIVGSEKNAIIYNLPSRKYINADVIDAVSSKYDTLDTMHNSRPILFARISYRHLLWRQSKHDVCGKA